MGTSVSHLVGTAEIGGEVTAERDGEIFPASQGHHHIEKLLSNFLLSIYCDLNKINSLK